MSEEKETIYEKYKRGASDEEEAKFLGWDIVREDIDEDEVQRRYDAWPEAYDRDMALVKFLGAELTARELLSYFYYNKDALILDCAAGTGACGQELADNGMTNLHCLDLNENMLKKAMSRGIYKKAIVARLGPEKTETPDNTYDGLLLSGAIFPGHIPITCLPELIRVVKPGGFIVLGHVVRPTDKEEFALMALHEARGLWKKMMWKYMPNFCYPVPGIVWCYQVL